MGTVFVAMFALREKDLAKPTPGCGDGPAGFNAEFPGRGGTIVSVLDASLGAE